MSDQIRKKPTRCPECKSKDMEAGYMTPDDEYDFEAASEAGVPDTKLDERFSFCYEMAECGECGATVAFGPRWYFNPITSNYTLNKPLVDGQDDAPINDPSAYRAPLL